MIEYNFVDGPNPDRFETMNAFSQKKYTKIISKLLVTGTDYHNSLASKVDKMDKLK